MITGRVYNRFSLVLWKTYQKQGKRRVGFWHYTVIDDKTNTGATGVVRGATKAAYEQARASATRWAMRRYNSSS